MAPEGAGPQLEEDWACDSEGRRASAAVRWTNGVFMSVIGDEVDRCRSKERLTKRSRGSSHDKRLYREAWQETKREEASYILTARTSLDRPSGIEVRTEDGGRHTILGTDDLISLLSLPPLVKPQTAAKQGEKLRSFSGCRAERHKLRHSRYKTSHQPTQCFRHVTGQRTSM
jgi:hypothetical protein